MSRLLLIGILYLADLSQAATYRLLDLDKASTEYWRTGSRRDPYQLQYTDEWTYGAAFNTNVRLLELFSWENHLHFDATESQIRNVGWEYKFKMDYFKKVQPFYYHHSEHATEDRESSRGYPLINTYGIELIWYERPLGYKANPHGKK